MCAFKRILPFAGALVLGFGLVSFSERFASPSPADLPLPNVELSHILAPMPVEDKIFTAKELTSRVVVLTKPEPSYTEVARAHEVTGEVVLRVVFSSSGEVTNIVPIKTLPDGLTEQAIEAARQIAFMPAQKDGRAVSQYATIVYNFSSY